MEKGILGGKMQEGQYCYWRRADLGADAGPGRGQSATPRQVQMSVTASTS